MQTQFDLKPLSREGVAAALEKAMRYRFLNEPAEAESICHDVLRLDGENQQALVILLLSLTDQFIRGYGVSAAQTREIVPRLKHPYEREYYSGIISEREAKARLQRAIPGCGFEAYDLLRDAMACYERAEATRPAGNDDALLRWNACARLIMQNRLEPREEERVEMQLE